MRDARKRKPWIRAAALLTTVVVIVIGVPGFGSRASAGEPSRPTPSDYVLGIGDVLDVSVWGYPDLTREVMVGPDGKITLPLVGPISAAGTTVDKLYAIITNAYKDYVVNPLVIVGIKAFRKIRAAALGQVTHPGLHDLDVGARVIDLIAAAGGLSDAAALARARLVRASGEDEPIDLEALLLRHDMSYNVALQPGDTVFVPEETNNRVFVVGDVKNPGAFPIKGSVTMLQAIAMAGGPNLKGAGTAKTAYIVRRGGADGAKPVYAGVAPAAKTDNLANGGTLITADLAAIMHDPARDVLVHPGDVVVVPQGNLSGLQFIVGILSGIAGFFKPF